jgi:hypothetical protein
VLLGVEDHRAVVAGTVLEGTAEARVEFEFGILALLLSIPHVVGTCQDQVGGDEHPAPLSGCFPPFTVEGQESPNVFVEPLTVLLQFHFLQKHSIDDFLVLVETPDDRVGFSLEIPRIILSHK